MRKRIIQMGVYLNSLPELKAVLIEELTVPGQRPSRYHRARNGTFAFQ